MLDQSYKKNSTAVTRGGSFGDCLAEAVGFSEDLLFVGGLTYAASSKAIKAAIKLALKSAGRAVPGIGLALLAAEVLWCMY